ncbi:MAG: hypothetical protein ACE5GQ_05170, partial [Nitrospinales bacterium]
ASIIKTQGPIVVFPWFQHTFWRDHFVDIHFLYHLFLIPFTSFDLVYGAKISTVFFFAVMAVVFHSVLKSAKVPFAWVWVVLLSTASSGFLYRMSLPRAPLAALSFLFLGSALVSKRNYRALFFLTFAFVWLYGGFTLFIALAGFMVLGAWLIEKRLDRKIISAVLFGAAAGLIVNPYFPDNAAFIYIQTITAGIDRAVAGGEEWLPYDWRELLESHMGLVLIFSAISAVFLSAKRKPRSDTLAWVLFLALTLCLTLESRRFIEYLIPAMAMASALLFRDGWEVMRHQKFFKEAWARNGLSCLIVAALLMAGAHRVHAAKIELYDSREPERYKQAALWLQQHTPGATIFNTDWDDFPEFFFYNSTHRFVVGLDPAFLYVYDKSLYRKWVEISAGTIKEDPYPILKNQFKTPYLFTDTRHGPFIKLMENHPLIELAYEDEHAKIYRLRKG